MAGVDRLSVYGSDLSGAFDSAVRLTSITKIVNKLRNGQPNIQIIGDPSIRYSVHFYADLATHDLLDQACTEGAEVTLHYHGEDYVGLIEEAEMPWEVFIEDEGNEWFEITFTLLVMEQL